jgi:hypothetical protein
MCNECYHASKNKGDNDNNKDNLVRMMMMMVMTMMTTTRIMTTVVCIKEINIPHALMLSWYLYMMGQ